MKKKEKFVLILGFIFCISTGVNGQSTLRAGEDIKDTVVSLLQNFGYEKVLVLFENKEICVTTSLSIFESDMNAWLEKNPNLKMDNELLVLITQQKKGKTIINAQKIARMNNLEERLGYRIAALLEKGACLIVSKKTMTAVSEIKVQTYSYYCGPLCGNGGRRFYINNTLFFKVMDWIS